MKENWTALFEEVKSRGSFVSDAEFAAHLGVSRAHVSAWRRGKTDLGTITKLRLLDALGRESLHSAVLSLLSDLDPESGRSQQAALISRVGRSRQPRSAGPRSK